MLPLDEQKKIEEKYFTNPVYKLDYFFEPLHMTKTGVRVLDVGCGSGQHLHLFSPDSVGISYTDDGVIAYVTEVHKLNLRKFNLDEEWPTDLGQFDVVFSSDSIIHCVSPFKLLLEMRQVLKDNGKVLLMIPQSSPFFNTDRSSLHPYTFNRKTMTNSFVRAGFKVEATYGYIRTLPAWINTLINPITKRWGPNLWVVASKQSNFKIREGNIRPNWVKPEIWPS